MVVCPEPPAAEVGRHVFSQGGNAIDAAVATAFAQSVTNPLLCGLGGTGIMHYYDAKTRQSLVLNFSVVTGSRPVPKSWAEECIGRAETIGRYIIRSEANQVTRLDINRSLCPALSVGAGSPSSTLAAAVSRGPISFRRPYNWPKMVSQSIPTSRPLQRIEKTSLAIRA